MEERGEVVGEGRVGEELDVAILAVRKVVATEVGSAFQSRFSRRFEDGTLEKKLTRSSARRRQSRTPSCVGAPIPRQTAEESSASSTP